jgi:PAS domain S-box-containing protein
MLGVTPPELLGRMLIEFITPDDCAKAESTFEQLRELGCRPTRLVIRLLSRDGKQVWTDCNIARSSGTDAGGFSVELHDVSAWRKSEDDLVWAQTQLVQQEKMASIGQLAAGVAHEINNPLGYVHSNLGTLTDYLRDVLRILDAYEAVERDVPPETPGWEALRNAKKRIDLEFVRKDLLDLVDESKEGMRRMEKIVGDLRDFSRAEMNDGWAFADVHRGLDSTLNIVNNEIKYKATVEKNYGTLPPVECRSSQLNQVFMNLLVNASQAIPDRGVIRIATGVEGDEVWVDISDTGTGIRPELLARIFDPFFTTKPVGAGTGLGLSLSYTIVQRHGGRIEVDSEPGRGTRFRVWLPIRQTAGKAASG